MREGRGGQKVKERHRRRCEGGEGWRRRAGTRVGRSGRGTVGGARAEKAGHGGQRHEEREGPKAGGRIGRETWDTAEERQAVSGE